MRIEEAVDLRSSKQRSAAAAVASLTCAAVCR